MKKSSVPIKKIKALNEPEPKVTKQKRGKKEKDIINIEEYDEKTKQKLLLNKSNIFKSSLSPSRSLPTRNYKPNYQTKFEPAKIPKIDLTLYYIPLSDTVESDRIDFTDKNVNSGSGGILKDILINIDADKLVREKGAKKREEYSLKDLKKLTRSMGMVQNFSRAEAVKIVLQQLRIYELITLSKYEEILSRLKK